MLIARRNGRGITAPSVFGFGLIVAFHDCKSSGTEKKWKPTGVPAQILEKARRQMTSKDSKDLTYQLEMDAIQRRKLVVEEVRRQEDGKTRPMDNVSIWKSSCAGAPW